MRALKKWVGATVCMIAVAWPAAAIADSCSNVSRAAPTNPNTVSKGNWVWLPSIGVPDPAWGKAPPGTADSTALGLPGANGNYTNGRTSSMLGMSNNCPPGNNTARQTTHGIQSGCA